MRSHDHVPFIVGDRDRDHATPGLGEGPQDLAARRIDDLVATAPGGEGDRQNRCEPIAPSRTVVLVGVDHYRRPLARGSQRVASARERGGSWGAGRPEISGG